MVKNAGSSSRGPGVWFPALYQAENAAIAYTAALWLHLLASPQAQGPYRPPAPTGTCTVPDRVRADLLRGLAGSAWEGRFEQIMPGVYLDGAHNADGIHMLLSSLRPLAKEGIRLVKQQNAVILPGAAEKPPQVLFRLTHILVHDLGQIRPQ